MLLCVSVSHKQAPISVREQLAVPAAQLPARLARLKCIPGVREAFLLATCNRLEIFAEASERGVADDLVRELGPQAAPHAAVRFETDALLHLLRVAASLDSMVVGEAQILGQLKDAVTAARTSGALGPRLGQAVATAVTAARRVRTETGIARGAVSVASVAAQLARKVLGDLEGKCVLLLGAGEMAQLAARELKADGVRELLVANRSPEHARTLAREVGGVPVSLKDLPALLERVDVVVCSTGAPHAIVTRELMERARKARRYRPIFLIDLSLPRNVEPAVNGLENTYLYDLDDLERVAAENRDLRNGELIRAEEILREELAAHLAAARQQGAAPVIKQLRAQAEAIAEAELLRTLGGLGLSEKQDKVVRAMARAIVNKLLHEPTARLRADAGGPLGEAAAMLFDLGEPAPPAVAELQPRARLLEAVPQPAAALQGYA